jgi:hypothetical protein
MPKRRLPEAHYLLPLYMICLSACLAPSSNQTGTREAAPGSELGQSREIDLAGAEASMNVRQLMAELALHPPDAIVITRSDETGFTDQITASMIKVSPVRPPILGLSHRAARAGEGAATAVLIGPPETF